MDIKKLMVAHRLNDSKTELIILGTGKQLDKVSCHSMAIREVSISCLPEVQNLGVIFYAKLTMEAQKIKSVELDIFILPILRRTKNICLQRQWLSLSMLSSITH